MHSSPRSLFSQIVHCAILSKIQKHWRFHRHHKPILDPTAARRYRFSPLGFLSVRSPFPSPISSSRVLESFAATRCTLVPPLKAILRPDLSDPAIICCSILTLRSRRLSLTNDARTTASSILLCMTGILYASSYSRHILCPEVHSSETCGGLLDLDHTL